MRLTLGTPFCRLFEKQVIMPLDIAESAAHSLSRAAVRESAVVRFAGDSGDGMQLSGTQFTLSTALAGNALATFPDFPAEIRAPQGSTFGVSAFQINFGSQSIETAGDEPDVLIAMNPAALKVNLHDLRPGGLIVVDSGAFTDRNLRKAGYAANPLSDHSLAPFEVVPFDITQLTLDAVKPHGLSATDAMRCKNMWALGLALWMFDRDREPVVEWIKGKFGRKNEALANANIAALNAGHAYGENAELGLPLGQIRVAPAEMEPGLYRTITGGEATALGLVAGSQLCSLPIFLGSYPITPASGILHHLSHLKEYDVTTFQAEDEIAAICAAIGASYAGKLGVTSTSGPGMALKTEAIGLAIMSELPLVIVNCQRGGPSTGLPTKTEQSDLYQAVYGRNGDAPLAVIAARSPSDCFESAIEAVRLAVQFMTPVILLTDGYMANAAEPWRLPDLTTQESFAAEFYDDIPSEGRINPYARDPETLKRIWIKPGTPGLTHRIGGIERNFETGEISYDPANHQKMTDTRKAKIDGIANFIPEQEVTVGQPGGKLAVVGWGSTFGAIQQGVQRVRASGGDVSHIHIRHLWPLPRNLGPLLRSYEKILVPEMNTGQLKTVLRDQYLVDAKSFSKVSGRPFRIAEIEAAILQALA
jgi:2-oxoglutarate ferredoxin oxidoreductase subunit alpha